jgi:hypothetical protein
MKRYLILLPVSMFFLGSVLCVQQLSRLHLHKENVSINYFVMLPEAFADIMALEFRGIIADFLMLNTLSFMGEKILTKTEVDKNEWVKVYHSLKQIIHLDPRARDPYVLAETTLPWEADMVKETNDLLLRVAKDQPYNHQPYFFLWFNHYYFLQDLETAGKYLQKSAKIPGAPIHYTTLASRMHLMAGQHQEGVRLLQELLDETTDPKRQEFLKMRLRSLKILHFLDINVQRYKQRYNEMPETLEDLVDRNIIKSIPPDPYGGTYYINERGRVYTTSKLVRTSEQ